MTLERKTRVVPRLPPGLALLLAVRFLALAPPLPATAEASPEPQTALPQIVLSEIMYHPLEDRAELQFIELQNPGDAAVPVSRWSLRGGVDCALPRGASIPPQGYVVVCRDLAAFRGSYGTSSNVIGTFTGSLSSRGERVELVDAAGKLVEAVEYGDRPPWPVAADGHGASLERICPASAAADPASWCASTRRTGSHGGGTPGRANSGASPVPLPRIAEVRHDSARPGEPIAVWADVRADAGVATVSLKWEVWSDDRAVGQGELPLTPETGDGRMGRYRGLIPAQPENCLIRFVIRAESEDGGVRHCPAAADLRPTFSCATYVNTNVARIAFLKALTFGRVHRASGSRRVQALADESGRAPWSTRLDWGSTVIILPPESSEVLVFDHVQVRPRKGGYRIEFQPDQLWRELRAVNVIFESSPRYVLAEPLAFELFRRAGVPTPRTDHVRLWVDHRALGYHLLVEQPNRAFFRRLHHDPDGNVYKLVWYGQGLIGQHDKKTNPRAGYEDLQGVVEGLNQTRGDEQWDFIRQHFDVDEVASYFAVNMCVQNWDGFFNNYYAYHDPRPGGKWQLVPWDQDKTWGDYDGASPTFDWYEMPLTFGMKGDKPPRGGWFGRWPVGGAGWWRPPGYFSGPLLANPEFRQRFLARLRELCETVFTPKAFGPAINALESRLEPEVVFRAQLQRQDPGLARQNLRRDLESFHRQLLHRRQFILQHGETALSSGPPELGRRP